MARDYKHRASQPRRSNKKKSVPGWKWLLIILIVGGFGYFLFTLGGQQGVDNQDDKPVIKPKAEVKNPSDEKAESTSQNPRFDFYKILPEKEVAVSDRKVETKTQTSEEHIAKVKNKQYLLQAGSFKKYKEADRLKARLALMGVESRIEKATINNVLWNRIKIGPFSSITAVENMRKRLQKNKIDTVVTKISG